MRPGLHLPFSVCVIITPRKRKGEAMAATEAQKRASAKYQREKTKQVNLKFSPNEMDMYDWLSKQGGTMSGTVKALIKKAMAE